MTEEEMLNSWIEFSKVSGLTFDEDQREYLLNVTRDFLNKYPELVTMHVDDFISTTNRWKELRPYKFKNGQKDGN
jgi:hypothetical protein